MEVIGIILIFAAKRVSMCDFSVAIDDSKKNSLSLSQRLRGIGHAPKDFDYKKELDITKTKGYQEAMEDIELGRVKTASSVDDMFNQILGENWRNV